MSRVGCSIGSGNCGSDGYDGRVSVRNADNAPQLCNLYIIPPPPALRRRHSILYQNYNRCVDKMADTSGFADKARAKPEVICFMFANTLSASATVTATPEPGGEGQYVLALSKGKAQIDVILAVDRDARALVCYSYCSPHIPLEDCASLGAPYRPADTSQAALEVSLASRRTTQWATTHISLRPYPAPAHSVGIARSDQGCTRALCALFTGNVSPPHRRQSTYDQLLL